MSSKFILFSQHCIIIHKHIFHCEIGKMCFVNYTEKCQNLVEILANSIVKGKKAFLFTCGVCTSNARRYSCCNFYSILICWRPLSDTTERVPVLLKHCRALMSHSRGWLCCVMVLVVRYYNCMLSWKQVRGSPQCFHGGRMNKIRCGT